MDACQGCLNKIILTSGKVCFRGKVKRLILKKKKKKDYSRKKTSLFSSLKPCDKKVHWKNKSCIPVNYSYTTLKSSLP